MKTIHSTLTSLALFIALIYSPTATSQTPFFQFGYVQPTYTTTTNILGVTILDTQRFDGSGGTLGI